MGAFDDLLPSQPPAKRTDPGFPKVSPAMQADRDAMAAHLVASELESSDDPDQQAILTKEYRLRFGDNPPTQPGAAANRPATQNAFADLIPKKAKGSPAGVFADLVEDERPSMLKQIALNNPLTALGETGLNLASQAVAMPVAGLAGLATEAGNALGLTKKTGTDAIHSVMDSLTYQPRGELGRATTELAMSPLEAVAKGGEMAGDATLDATDSPNAAATVASVINALPLAISPALKAGKAKLAKMKGETPADGLKPQEEPALTVPTDSTATPATPSAPPVDGFESYITTLRDNVLDRIRRERESLAGEGAADRLAELDARERDIRDRYNPDNQSMRDAWELLQENRPATQYSRSGRQMEHAPDGIEAFAADLQAQAKAGIENERTGLQELIDGRPSEDYLETPANLRMSPKEATARLAELDAREKALPERFDPADPAIQAAWELQKGDQASRASFSPGAKWVGNIDDSALNTPEPRRTDPIRREDILADLVKALDTTIYEGRVKIPGVEGLFSPRKEVVRIRKAADIETASHEIAHLIEDRFPEIKLARTHGKHAADFDTELKGVSYDHTNAAEGFAEFVRLYMTQPGQARARAPKFFDWFEKKFLADPDEPKLGAAIRKAQADMTAWFAQDAIDRARSKIGSRRSINDAFDGFWDRFRQATVDDLHGVYRMERDLKGRIEPTGAYESARLSRASHSIAEGAVNHGYPVKQADGSFTYKGKGLREILEPLGENLDDALLYFVGRSAQELMMQGREHLFTRAEIKAMVDLATPERKKAFNEYQAWNRGVLDFAQESGVINPAARAMWQRQNYLPFHRVGQPGDFRGKPGEWSGIKALTGGTENIRDVLGNMIGNAAMLIDKAVKNEARQKIAALADSERGAGRFMAQIDPESRPVRIDPKQVVDAVLKTLGIDARDPAMGEIVKQLREQIQNDPDAFEFMIHGQAPAGGNVVAVLHGGKPTFYEVADPVLYRALSAIDRPHQNMVVKWLGLPKRIGQTTVTLTPDFMVANIARDTLMGSVMSRAGFRPVIDSLEGMRLRIKNDPIYRDFIANGGGLSSIYLDEAKLRARLEKFYQRQGIDVRTVLDAPEKLLGFVETLADAFETSTRLGEYKRAIQAGENPRHAAYLGREVSTDFAMRGDSQALNFMYDTVMFLKPAVLSMDRLFRGFTHDPNKRAVAAKTGMFALFSMALYALNRQDERYRDLPDWERDSYWHFFVGDQHFRYPKIWEVGALSSAAERTLEKVLETDSGGLGKDLLRILGNTFNLNLMPQILAPIYEQATNKNSFTGAKIETPGMENEQPFLRAKPTTSETLKAAGMATRNLPESLQVNPVRAEALLRGYFNTWALYGLALTDHAFFGDKLPATRADDVPVVRRFYSEQPPKTTKYETMFYDMLGEAQRLRGTLKSLDKLDMKGIADELEKNPMATEAVPLEHANKKLRAINADMRAVRRGDLSPEEKRQRLDALTVERNELLKAAVQDAQKAQKTKAEGQ